MMEVMDRMDGTRHKKWKVHKKEKGRDGICSLGDDLPMVEADWITRTEGEENRRRRTLLMKRGDQTSWGFTLQSYGIQSQTSSEVEMLTYVDYVEVSSPAYLAGLRPGDVILSINGVSMEENDHQDLVSFIKHSGNSMRMVVLFEDCCRKVDLHGRCLKLKRVLAEKIFEMRSLEEQEKRLMSGLTRFDSCRSSRASSSSSLYSGHDDRFSLRPELDICPVTPSPASSTSFENFKQFDDAKIFEALRNMDLSATPCTPESPFRNRFSFDRSSMMSNLSAITFAGIPSQWENGSLDHLVHIPISVRLKPQARQSTFGSIRNQRRLVASQSYAGKHDYSGNYEDVARKPRPMSEGQLGREGHLESSRRRRHHSLEKVRHPKSDLMQETSFINLEKSYGSIPEDLQNSVHGSGLFRQTVEKNHQRRSLGESSTSEGRRCRHGSGKKQQQWEEKLHSESQDGASSDYDNKNQEETKISPTRPPRMRKTVKRNMSHPPVLNARNCAAEHIDLQPGDDPHVITQFPFHGPLHSSPYSTHSTSFEDSSLQFPHDPNDSSLQFHNPSYHLMAPVADQESSSDLNESLDIHYKGYDTDSSSYFDSSSGYLDSPIAPPFVNSNANNANVATSVAHFPHFVLPRIQLEFINERDENTKL